MDGLTFWKRVVMDQADFLNELSGLFHDAAIRCAVIGGQAVNAYADPLASLDLDVVIAIEDLPRAEALLRERFSVEPCPPSLNVSRHDSKLRVQIQTDPRYFEFVARATVRPGLAVPLPVAALEDVLQGKIWGAQDTTRPSKRRKDLLDVERLIEAYPALRSQVPTALLKQLES
jgi:hypothetical protein